MDKKDIKLNEKYHNFDSRHLKEHEGDDNQIILWDDPKILHRDNNSYKRAFAEMIFIKKQDTCLNKVNDIGNLKFTL